MFRIFSGFNEEKRPLTNLIPVLSFPQRPLAFITTKRKMVKKENNSNILEMPGIQTKEAILTNIENRIDCKSTCMEFDHAGEMSPEKDCWWRPTFQHLERKSSSETSDGRLEIQTNVVVLWSAF